MTKTKQKILLPILALLTANALWGLNAPLIKMGLESIPVPAFIAIRILIASLVLLPFALRAWKPLTRKDFLLLMLSSLFYITLSVTALNIGLTKTTAINAGVIWLLSPILLFVLSASFLKEKLSIKTFIGTSIALAGALIIIGKPWEAGVHNTDELVGNLFIIVAVFCNIISTIICKPLTKKTTPYQLTFMNLFPGAIPIMIFAITQLPSFDVDTVASRSIWGLVFSTIAIIFANLLFFWALKYKKVQSTGVYQYVDFTATIVGAWFLLSERPSTTFVVGASLILVGVYTSEVRNINIWKRKYRRKLAST